MDGQQQQQQSPFSGPPNPANRRQLHIAHRRSPSEVTPLVSMYTANPHSESFVALRRLLSLFAISTPLLEAGASSDGELRPDIKM